MQTHLRCDVEPSAVPSVLFPLGRGRAPRRLSISRHALWLGQVLLLTLAAAALTGFLRRALA